VIGFNADNYQYIIGGVVSDRRIAYGEKLVTIPYQKLKDLDASIRSGANLMPVSRHFDHKVSK